MIPVFDEEGYRRVWDNTTIQAIQQSPAYYGLAYNGQVGWDEQKSHFEFGRRYHTAMETRLRHLYWGVLPDDPSLPLKCVDAALSSSETDLDAMGDRYRSTRLLKDLVEGYCHFYAYDTMRPTTLAGKPSYEVNFCLPLMWDGEPLRTPTGAPCFLAGYVDSIVKSVDGGPLMIMEHKHTTTTLNSWFKSSMPMHQLLTYCWALNTLDQPINRQAIVDCAQVKLRDGPAYGRNMVHITVAEAKEHIHNVMLWIKSAHFWTAEGWPHRTYKHHTYGLWNDCLAQPRSNQLNYLRSHVAPGPVWNPSEPRH